MKAALSVGDILPDCGPQTQHLLDIYAALLRRWNASINLVARSSLDDLWHRHIVDSLQLLTLRTAGDCNWLDIGSGAGLPGIVVALAAVECAPEMRVRLVEADQRKAEFLRSVSRETGVGVEVICERIESLPSQRADIVSARALAALPKLCAYADPHLADNGRAIFLKGAKAEAEIAAARKDWHFDLTRHPSITDPEASILVLAGLRHA